MKAYEEEVDKEKNIVGAYQIVGIIAFVLAVILVICVYGGA